MNYLPTQRDDSQNTAMIDNAALTAVPENFFLEMNYWEYSVLYGIYIAEPSELAI